ncbi:MAG: MFS transporter [Acidimicrobiia bacterium]|nr:MFS transporter [Acidimicrobiia bacterium]
MRFISYLRKGVPGTVVALGFASLFTDFASEMIYPLVPAFLTDVLGVGALALGVIEGIAESTASILKIVSGWWTDRTARRKPFVFAGYGIAGAVRPLIGLATSWVAVVAIRFIDRVGKGIRTAPRDALIADATPPESRGAAYGVHRSMDHFGAVIGPLAAALLIWLGLTLRQVFLAAFVPAVFVIVIIARFVREPGRDPNGTAGPRPVLRRWRDFGPGFWRLMAAVFIFTLGNSADAFLLLRLFEASVSLVWVAVLWSLFSLVKMAANLAGGRLSDRVGRKWLVLAGWTVYAAVYLGMALTSDIALLIALFLVYGIHFGFTEPVERAWVADLAPADLRGSGFGYYNGAIGIGALPANLLFGGIWAAFGPRPAFLMGAAFAGVAAIVLLGAPERRDSGAGQAASVETVEDPDPGPEVVG